MESARTLCVDNGDPRGARWDCPNITTDDFLSCKELCFDEVCKVGPENAQMVDHQMYFLSYQNEGTSDFSWIFQLKNLKGSSVDFHFGTWLSYPEPPEVASALMLGQDDENFIYLAWGANSIRGRDPELFCESHYLVLSTKGTNCSSLRGTARGLRVNRCIDESTDSNMSGIVYNYDVSCD